MSQNNELQGWVTKFNAEKRMGLIEDSEYRQYLIEPGSFRRTTQLRVGNKVWFTSQNLLAGPTAQDITPIVFRESPNRK